MQDVPFQPKSPGLRTSLSQEDISKSRGTSDLPTTQPPYFNSAVSEKQRQEGDKHERGQHQKFRIQKKEKTEGRWKK